MEIQQKEETIAAYVHHFKTKAKGCDFIKYTATNHIFIKGLKDAHNITEKVYKKDPQTLSQVIKSVEKLDTAQPVTATLSPPMVNMMSNDDSCSVCGKKGHIACHCPQAQCYNCDDFCHFAQRLPRDSLFS